MLNPEVSDDIVEALKPSRKQLRQRRHSPVPLTAPPPLLTTSTLGIRQRGVDVDLLLQNGGKITVTPDGAAAPVSLSGWSGAGGKIVRLSYWEGDTLVVESTLDSGVYFVNSYYVDSDGLLVQNVELTRPGLNQLVIRRRFDPL